MTSTFLACSADGYERLMGRWSRRLAEPFLDFCGSTVGGVVLDAGCGTGSLAFALSQRSGFDRIEGLDLASAYIEAAREKNQDSRVALRVGDICALPFEDKSFDCVLSLLVLHFIPAPHIAITEMRRVARPGSTVAAAVWDIRGGSVANRIFFDTAAAIDGEANVRRSRNYTRPLTRPGELVEAWRNAGFTDVRQTMLTIRMEFSSFEDYWAPFAGRDGPVAEYILTLSATRREDLRELVRRAYVDGEPDGPRSYAASAWAVAGQA